MYSLVSGCETEIYGNFGWKKNWLERNQLEKANADNIIP